MALAQPEFQLEDGEVINKQSNEDTLKLLERLKTPELVIGLCGPIGSPLNEVTEECKKILQKINYNVHVIKLSAYIKEHFKDLIKDAKYSHYEKDYLDEGKHSKFEIKKRLIEIGNCLREKYNSTFLAECMIRQRSIERQKGPDESSNTDDPAENLKYVTTGKRVAFIINSIKNQSEYELLKNVYRDLFYMIGVTSSMENRINSLCDQNNMSKSQVWELIDEETGEEIRHGQTVKDTFPLSDYFININSNNSDLAHKIFRFFSLTFCIDSESSHIYIPTPTIQETSMYMAASAAWNSSCLSRQVGAVLTDFQGEILSVGWNDVPVYGGGLYHHNKEKRDEKIYGLFYNPKYKDERCFNLRFCANDQQKNIMSKKIVEALDKENLLNTKISDYKKTAEDKIRKSKISSLVEFSRSIHAEMHAIISGCITSGQRVKNGKLYITTYPCHICARHIILAGIKEVYFIEPYRKSLTITLHGDSITDDEDLKVEDVHKVIIRQFEGVGPNRYMQLFKMLPESRKQKLTGQLFENQDGFEKTTPKYSISLTAIPTIESQITSTLLEKLK